jgi:hypothetical protein
MRNQLVSTFYGELQASRAIKVTCRIDFGVNNERHCKIGTVYVRVLVRGGE